MEKKHYVLSNKHLTAKINRTNGELESLIFNNKEFVYQRNETWKRCWPILFPFAGKLNNQMFTYNNKKYTMPAHGFVKDNDIWECTKNTSTHLTLVFKSNGKFSEIYPFEFVLKLEYQLAKQNLINKVTIINKSSTIMYYGFGWHPAFILDNKNGFIRTQFKSKLSDIPESDYWSSSMRKTLVEKIKVNSLDFDKSQSYGIFDNTNKELTVCDGEREFEITSEEYPLIVIWKNGNNSNYLCVEPWSSLMDELNSIVTELKDKKGIQSLDKHKKRKYYMIIKIIK